MLRQKGSAGNNNSRNIEAAAGPIACWMVDNWDIWGLLDRDLLDIAGSKNVISDFVNMRLHVYKPLMRRQYLYWAVLLILLWLIFSSRQPFLGIILQPCHEIQWLPLSALEMCLLCSSWKWPTYLGEFIHGFKPTTSELCRQLSEILLPSQIFLSNNAPYNCNRGRDCRGATFDF